MSIPTLRRYLAREIYGSILFVIVAFLALFAFFDLINELGDLGKGQYRLQHALGFVLLSLPGHVYEQLQLLCSSALFTLCPAYLRIRNSP